MLASVSGLKMKIDAIRSRVRRMSAFCEGGRGGADSRTELNASLPNARKNLIGRMVKVYRKESRQRTNPNSIIWKLP